MARNETASITLKILANDLASGKVGAFIGKIDTLAKRGGIMGSVFQGVGIQMGMMLNPIMLRSRGFGLLKDVVGDAIGAASEMAETQTKLDAVYLEAADTIRDWGEDAAQAMGMSSQAALDAAGNLGALFQAMEVGEPVAAEMSQSIVGLAADLASFFDSDPSEVIVALRSGLSGMTAPMKRFGVDVSMAAVKTQLLADGVEMVDGAFTQAQKVQGRYRVILNQTTKAQGNFGLTAEDTANKQRTLAGTLKDSQARLGTFADDVTKAATGLAIDLVGGIDAVAAALERLQRFLSPHSAEIDDVVRVLRKLAKEHGLNAEAVILYAQRQREANEIAEDTALAQKLLRAEVDKHAASLFNLILTENDRNELVRIYEEDLRAATDATRTAIEFTNEHTEAAEGLLEAYQNLPEGSRAALDAQTDLSGVLAEPLPNPLEDLNPKGMTVKGHTPP